MIVLFLNLLICSSLFSQMVSALYVYQAKDSLLQKTEHIVSLHTFQKVVPLLYLYLYLAYDITY